MIVSKTPLRLSLGGGGTDLPSYYNQYDAHIVTAAVQKYVYVFAKRWFEKGIRVSYSKTELVNSIDEIQHPIVREALRMLGPQKQIEIVSMADVPARTGMGSSASFGVGLLNVLHAINKTSIEPQRLAEMAFKIQNEMLKEVGGKQDQYAAAVGGIVSLHIEKGGNVSVRNLDIADEVVEELENNLMCFYTGVQRNSSDIQKSYLNDTRPKMDVDEVLHEIKKIAYEVQKALESCNLNEFGMLLHRHWLAKRSLSNSISNSNIDKLYQDGLAAGALGGKIMGAGGGGFIIFYVENGKKSLLRKEMARSGMEEIKLRFDFQGSKIVANI